MTTLLVSDFKTRCIEILNAVHDGGESVLVTRRGKPLARIVPVADKTGGKRHLGALAGEASEEGEVVHTDFASDWESLK